MRTLPRTIGAVDAAFGRTTAYGAACLFSFPTLELLEEATAEAALAIPYVPGYLSFREGPALAAALGKLSRAPSLLLVDGQGIAHPRRCGLASHLGVVLGIASVGCAKSRLIGEYRELARSRGSRSALVHDGDYIGFVLRTRTGVRPVFVSPGHRIDAGGAVEIVLATTRGFRIPEPLRRADALARAAARADRPRSG